MMKKFKKYAACLMLGLAVASIAAGCKGKEEETESVADQLITEEMTETDTEVEEKEGTAVIKTKKYTSRDKTISITLPDSSWSNTKDTEDTLEFEGDGGTISIVHLTGTSVSSVQLPESKEEVLENLSKAGKDTSKYEVTEFTQKKLGTKDQYFTVVKCVDTTEDYVYSVGYDLVSTTEIYSVTGLVEEDDETLLAEMQTAVESFKVLKSSTSSNTTSDITTDPDGSESAAGTSRVIYDSNGNAITVTKDTAGIWKDSTGKTYDLQQYGAMGSDGYWYTYQSSTGTSGTTSTESTESSGGNSGDNSGDTNTDNPAGGTTGGTSGFYDQDGNYVTVTQDANGNWVDSYGTTYSFGDSGVTDNAGNYYPYPSDTQSNGFYDSNGNYVLVTKDSNGNWVDSAGNAYTFGDTGVTDAAGNFYPY